MSGVRAPEGARESTDFAGKASAGLVLFLCPDGGMPKSICPGKVLKDRGRSLAHGLFGIGFFGFEEEGKGGDGGNYSRFASAIFSGEP